MDIRQLRYFVAIAEERQITAAARRLHIAQPPLSQQLRGMEQELGVKLAERMGKQLKLTEAGELLYQHALSILRMMEQSQLEVQETGNGLRGQLTIGVNTLSNDRLPELLLRFQSQYPNITYKIQQNESAQLCKLVRERAIELAIIRLPLELSDFHVWPLCMEAFYYVTSNRSDIPDHSAVTLERIHQVPLIVPSTEGLGLYKLILDTFARRGLTPNIACECSDMYVLMELVASGFGSTIVPEAVLKLHKGYEVQVHPIADAELTASSGLIWLKQHYLSRTAQHFIEVYKSPAT
ncbi:MAG: LysR family transcriptional regulator [Paenibacillus sp.]|nr:LysR family transcriptional regulator [Paenibacillus sp.]